jgi:hypothetical protein
VDTHRRKASLLATLMAGVLLLAGAAPAFAGDTRIITIGSLSGGAISDGTLTTTPVSAGEQALLVVSVKNGGQQTINNVQFQVGLDGRPSIDESNPPPASLPDFPVAFTDGSTLTVVSTNPVKTCQPAPGVPASGPVSCAVGSLTKGKSFTITLLLTAGTAGVLDLKATVKVSENANDSGGAANIDTFAAEGAVNVAAPSCTGLFGYLPAGLEKHLATTTLGCDQAIDLFVPVAATNKNAVIRAVLNDLGATDTTTSCLSGISCFGDAFEISVNDGTKLDKSIEVTLVWNTLPAGFNINKAGIVHIGATKTVVVDTSKKSECTTTKLTDCWTQSVYDGTTWTFTVRFPENGVVRGK